MKKIPNWAWAMLGILIVIGAVLWWQNNQQKELKAKLDKQKEEQRISAWDVIARLQNQIKADQEEAMK